LVNNKPIQVADSKGAKEVIILKEENFHQSIDKVFQLQVYKMDGESNKFNSNWIYIQIRRCKNQANTGIINMQKDSTVQQRSKESTNTKGFISSAKILQNFAIQSYRLKLNHYKNFKELAEEKLI
jgi:hypothetical protein